ncbi:MAG TPA: threonine ammonia-lyase, partial [Kandleria vitulina]|nr:threonine ammonia-lyase [Kandleria vitulina]
KNKKVVCLVSGGNIDVRSISSMINKGLIERGRIFSFSVQLPDKPGQLVYVSQVLAKLNANVIAVDHNQFRNFEDFGEVELRVTCETNGESHIHAIMEAFRKDGYTITRIN